MRPLRRRISRLKPQPGMYTDLPTAGKPEQSARLPDSKRPANDEQQARESEKAFEEALTRTPP